MLRLRRTLAFSSRVHNYLVLVYLFFLALYATQLWWDTALQFTQFVVFVATLLTVVGIAYAVVLLLIALILWIVDRIFPTLDVITTVARVVVFVMGWAIISLFSSLANEGFIINF